MAEQNCINKRSGRKCRNFEEAEKEYQTAQNAWDKNPDNKQAWDIMFTLINNAVFNCLNKDLEHKLDREEIEGRSLDITMNIMRAILNKRKKGVSWKIGKLSSAVHLPCMAKYDRKLQFADTCLLESVYTLDKSDQTQGIESILDNSEYRYAQGYGFSCISGIPEDWNLPEYDGDEYEY